jgi:acetyl esterase/lipase
MTPCVLCLAVVFGLTAAAPSLEAQTGKPKTLVLWEKGAPGALGETPADTPNIRLFLPPADKATGAAVIICPGGGYGALADTYEGVDVARWFNRLGVAGIVLKYRLGPRYRHPAPLQDAQRAIRLTRHHAKEWGVDPNRVGILGFSAGGHLAATASTHFDEGDPRAEDPVERSSSRPDFSILVYAVITFTDPYTHGGSRNNLLGKSPDPKLIELLSNEKQVSKRTPPAFLVHTSEDKAVPPENSVLYYLACRKAGVTAELHVFEKGRHGLGMGPKGMPFSTWPQLCEAWLNDRKLIRTK